MSQTIPQTNNGLAVLVENFTGTTSINLANINSNLTGTINNMLFKATASGFGVVLEQSVPLSSITFTRVGNSITINPAGIDIEYVNSTGSTVTLDTFYVELDLGAALIPIAGGNLQNALVTPFISFSQAVANGQILRFTDITITIG